MFEKKITKPIEKTMTKIYKASADYSNYLEFITDLNSMFEKGYELDVFDKKHSVFSSDKFYVDYVKTENEEVI